MGKRMVLLSTGVGVVDTIVSLVRKCDPNVEIINIVDDSIVDTIGRNGNRIPETIARRIAGYCRNAEDSGADGVLVTCSSISETVDWARPLVSIPIYKIDEPMAEHAVAVAASRIGVVATLETTLKPTMRLIESKIKLSRKNIALESLLAAGAFQALQGGQPEQHDAIVLKAIQSMLPACDVVVLAQASMARAAAKLDAADSRRVLTSPQLGVERALSELSRTTA